MIAMGNNEISTGWYADFFSDWYDLKIKNYCHPAKLQFKKKTSFSAFNPTLLYHFKKHPLS